MSDLARRTAAALANSQQRAILARNLSLLRRWRAAALTSAEAFAELRDQATAVRRRNLAQLPDLLARLEEQVTAAGAVVHWAEDAEAACAVLAQLAQQITASPVLGHRPRPCRVVRVGNQIGAEIGLDAALQAVRAQVTDLPLGDYILHMAGDGASHPVFPAIHVRKETVAALFRERLDLPETLDPQAMASMARYHQRRDLFQADLAISEAALAVAETGALALATVDGSERLAVSLAPMHVVLMSVADVVATLDELFLLMRARALSGLGQPCMPSLTLLHGPARSDEQDGPRQLHLIIVDNGRSELIRRGFGEALACIRCGACANVCPAYGEVGGGVYGSAQAGPIGAVVIPLRPASPGLAHQGTARRPLPVRRPAADASAAELPWASTLCGACAQVCPVGIDIPALLSKLRSESPRSLARAWTWAALSPERYWWLARALASAGRSLSVEALRPVAPPLHPWARVHRWPPPAAHSFRERWERRQRAQAARPTDHG